jgi:hypothetical protein
MKNIDLIIILLIFLIIIIYLEEKNKKNNYTIIRNNIKSKQAKRAKQSSLMLNNTVNINRETDNLLKPESSTSKIKSEIGGSKPYKNVIIDDNNLKLNVINYDTKLGYRKLPFQISK